MAMRHYHPGILTIILLVLAGCAPSLPKMNDTQVFPPSPLLPIKIAITAPLVKFSHENSHQILEPWNESPGQRRLLMSCVWQDGLQNLVRKMIPGTEISCFITGRNPLDALSLGVVAEADTMGRIHFKVEHQSTLDLARRRGWTHLVVPYELNYSMATKGEEFRLDAAVAIIDILEQRLVWQGIIDSERVSEKSLGDDDDLLPALTNYESITYRFVLDLVEIMQRPLNSAPESRHAFAGPCQDPPPLLRE